jgi:2-polyprenyl-3-methyl-5-hydroxy-6-metoxy-1,4-benzoquinol methylase
MTKPSYYQQQRTEILGLIDTPPRKVLDIGCGKGGVASTLRHHHEGLSISGFDKYKDDAFDYSSVFDTFHNFDLTGDWPELEYGSYDLVLLLDVLEHLNEPQAILEKLSTLLAPGCRLVVSLPNFHYYSNLYEIVKSGRFQYKESGILDRTHVRFFGQQDARELISRHFEIVKFLPHQLQQTTASKLVNLTLGDKYSAYQNVFLCSKKK